MYTLLLASVVPCSAVVADAHGCATALFGTSLCSITGACLYAAAAAVANMAAGRILTLLSLQRKASAPTAAARKRPTSSKKPKTPTNKPAADAAATSPADQQQNHQGPQAAAPPAFQQQQLAAAARKQTHDDDSDEDYDPAADPTPAAADTPAAAAGSSRKGKAAAAGSRGGAYSAAAHTWVQPPACENLRFDMQALRAALDQSAAAAAQPRMFLSSATLVIVPVTLIPHWQQQVGVQVLSLFPHIHLTALDDRLCLLNLVECSLLCASCASSPCM